MTVNHDRYKFSQEQTQEQCCTECLKVVENPPAANADEIVLCESCLLQMKDKVTLRKKASLKYSKYGLQSPLTGPRGRDRASVDILDGKYSQLPYSRYQADVYTTHVTQQSNAEDTQKGSRIYSSNLEGHGKTGDSPSIPQQSGVTVNREELMRHRSSYPVEIMECPFKDMGCKEKMLFKDKEEHMSLAMTTHILLLLSNQDVLKHELLSMDKSQWRLQAECSQLKTTNENIMSKINHVKVLLPSLRASVQPGESMYYKLGQLDTVLTEFSTVAIGASMTVELSKKLEKGHHFVIVDNVTFKLQWTYAKSMLELQLLQSDPDDMPETLSCDFIAKLEPHEEQLGQPSHSVASAIKKMGAVCNGESKTYDHEHGATRKPVGAVKTVLVDSDTSLTLTVREHQHVASCRCSSVPSLKPKKPQKGRALKKDRTYR